MIHYDGNEEDEIHSVKWFLAQV